MNFITIIISLSLSIIDILLIGFYLKNTLKPNHQKHYHIFLRFIIMLSLLFLFNSDVTTNVLLNYLIFLIALVIAIYKFNYNKHDLIKYMCLFILTKFILNYTFLFLFEWIFDTSLAIRGYHFLISYKLLLQFSVNYLQFAIIIYYINKLHSHKIELHYFKILSIIFSIYFCAAIILNNDKLFYFPNIGRTFVFVIVVYNIALIMFDRYQRRAEQIEKDFLITKQNIDLEKQYIKEVGERNDLVRAFRHDFKNKITIISGLIQKDLGAEAITELETILGETIDLTVGTYVDNVYVDTAIDAKVKIIKRKGFEFNETYGLISIGNICAADLALAVALAMDNAIEAVDSIKDAKQMITLDIRTNKNYIIMTLSNSIQPGTKVQFSHTSKTEQIENHGFGVKKIRSIADAYDGDAKYEVYDDHVTLKLFMSISKGIEKEKA